MAAKIELENKIQELAKTNLENSKLAQHVDELETLISKKDKELNEQRE
jgi:hypothetical protein